MILKPAEQTPLTAILLGEVFEEAGFPPGVVNIVTGYGDAGAALSAHDDVDKIAFTGSTEVGKKIVDAARGNLKKVSLELGGKSANVVFADADFDAAVTGSLNAWLFNHGQCCVAGTRMFVEDSIFDDFTAAVAEAAGQVKIGPGLDPPPNSDRWCRRNSSTRSPATWPPDSPTAPAPSPAESAGATPASTSSRRCSWT